jgi:hypothetical protein
MNRSYLNRNLLMLRSESSNSRMKFQKRPGIPFFCIVAAFLTLLPSAFGQDFSMSVASFNPFAVDPGEASSANITLTALNGFNGSVGLTCAITSDTSGTPPTCQISPPSVQPSGGASATITTTGSTTAALYKITITGTSPATTISQSQNLTVLSVTPQFTITVQTAIAPSSVPAGSGAQGVVSVNPINGYSSPSNANGKGITLSCASITPLVTLPPVCSFNPQPLVVNGSPATSTLTISTTGPPTTAAVAHTRSFYALWIPLPMLALAGLGAAAGGTRSRKAWGLLALFIVSGSLLLMPACGNSSTPTTTPNGVTPANSYTFTIVGVDIDGNISSNTNSSGTNPSVSLTVTAPSKVP